MLLQCKSCKRLCCAGSLLMFVLPPLLGPVGSEVSWVRDHRSTGPANEALTGPVVGFLLKPPAHICS